MRFQGLTSRTVIIQTIPVWPGWRPSRWWLTLLQKRSPWLNGCRVGYLSTDAKTKLPYSYSKIQVWFLRSRFRQRGRPSCDAYRINSVRQFVKHLSSHPEKLQNHCWCSILYSAMQQSVIMAKLKSSFSREPRTHPARSTFFNSFSSFSPTQMQLILLTRIMFWEWISFDSLTIHMHYSFKQAKQMPDLRGSTIIRNHALQDAKSRRSTSCIMTLNIHEWQ